MQFGLTENEVRKIILVFSSFSEVEKVIVYGSRAKGNFKPGSDIDMAVLGKDLHFYVLNEISNHLDDLFMPYIFDLAIYHQIENQDLIDHIKRVGMVFYTKEELITL